MNKNEKSTASNDQSVGQPTKPKLVLRKESIPSLDAKDLSLVIGGAGPPDGGPELAINGTAINGTAKLV